MARGNSTFVAAIRLGLGALWSYLIVHRTKRKQVFLAKPDRWFVVWPPDIASRTSGQDFAAVVDIGQLLATVTTFAAPSRDCLGMLGQVMISKVEIPKLD